MSNKIWLSIDASKIEISKFIIGDRLIILLILLIFALGEINIYIMVF